MPYYAGDPGFLSGIGRLVGAAAGFIPGIGPIASRGIQVVSGIAGRVGKAAARHPTITAIGGAAASGVAGAGAERLMAPGAARMRGVTLPPGGLAPKGYHMSKPYKCHGTIIPSHLVRNRHMRSTNPRALRRAIRRARGFERLARKVMRFVSPRAHKGRAVFRTRRRSK